jgi:hypothetical protein
MRDPSDRLVRFQPYNSSAPKFQYVMMSFMSRTKTVSRQVEAGALPATGCRLVLQRKESRGPTAEGS